MYLQRPSLWLLASFNSYSSHFPSHHFTAKGGLMFTTSYKSDNHSQNVSQFPPSLGLMGFASQVSLSSAVLPIFGAFFPLPYIARSGVCYLNSTREKREKESARTSAWSGASKLAPPTMNYVGIIKIDLFNSLSLPLSFSIHVLSVWVIPQWREDETNPSRSHHRNGQRERKKNFCQNWKQSGLTCKSDRRLFVFGERVRHTLRDPFCIWSTPSP